MKPYYEDPAVTIYHGDCLELLPEMPKADLVMTDPPYLTKDIGKNHLPALHGGDVPQDEYSIFCKNWYDQCAKNTDRLVFTSGIAHIWEYPSARWVLCWNKPGSVSFSRFGGYNGWEPILVYGELPKGCRVPNDVMTFTPLNRTSGPEINHPCPKHLGMWKKLMFMISLEAEMILDPFMGSGTTLRAAKDLGRKAIGIEVEERYCEIAAKRMAQEVLL